MSNINTNDIGGITSPDHNSNTKTYQENGLPRNKWGMQYDIGVRRIIVDDIRSGKLSLDEMAEMLDLWRSAILKWKGSDGSDLSGIAKSQQTQRKIVTYTRTPGCPGTNGKTISKELRIEIVSAIIGKRISLDEAVRKYRVYRSKLLRWCESKDYNLRALTSTSKPIAPITQPVSNVDKLMLNQGHTRFVLDLLLSGSHDKAAEAARLFLSK